MIIITLKNHFQHFWNITESLSFLVLLSYNRFPVIKQHAIIIKQKYAHSSERAFQKTHIKNVNLTGSPAECLLFSSVCNRWVSLISADQHLKIQGFCNRCDFKRRESFESNIFFWIAQNIPRMMSESFISRHEMCHKTSFVLFLLHFIFC